MARKRSEKAGKGAKTPSVRLWRRILGVGQGEISMTSNPFVVLLPLTVLVLALVVPGRATAASEQITVASWNVSCLSKTHDEERRKNGHYQRLTEIVTGLSADVIALQEVDRDVVKEVFSTDTYSLEISNRTNNQNTGFAIRRGIQYKRMDDVAELDSVTKSNVRYGTHIEVVVENRPIDVLSVHLKSGCFSKKEDDDKRRKTACASLHNQIPVLKAWIDSKLKSQRSIIVLGDFNRRLAIEGDELWTKLSEDGNLTLTTAGIERRCWGGGVFPPGFIDHIVLGPQTSSWMTAFKEVVFEEAKTTEGFYKLEPEKQPKYCRTLSDHCPILATFAVKKLEQEETVQE